MAIAGPSTAPIELTSLSLLTAAQSGASPPVALYGYHVPSSATNCSGATLDGTLWQSQNAGGPTTPVSVSVPTPLQYKPLANTKACVFAYGPDPSFTALNASGFYG